MLIKILGAESLGVRGLCCFIKIGNQQILIDPGISLGYIRHGFLPHPLQVAVDEVIQKKIIKAWFQATDIIISHFHGDHVPLIDANPYQLSVKKLIGLNKKVNIWIKNSVNFSPLEKQRAVSLEKVLKVKFIQAEDKKIGKISFSKAVPHGSLNEQTGTVMMTRIKSGNEIFVHASDIQLLNKEAISKILSWKPNIALVGGPPLYLGLSKDKQKQAWENARILSQNIDVLILDHHLLRSKEGLAWLKELDSKTENKVLSSADFMGETPLLLEAWRGQLYSKIPVPKNWHESYAQDKVSAKPYLPYLKQLKEL
jgi:predicted metallo-beta-lactamase superfamily hydrolase